MAESEKKDPVEKLKGDVEFWRKGVEKVEAEKREMGAQLVAQSSELVAVKDAIISIEGKFKELSNDRNMAATLLRQLADHVRGRDGMLQLSNTFCEVCQNPNTCPMGAVREFIGGTLEAA